MAREAARQPFGPPLEARAKVKQALTPAQVEPDAIGGTPVAPQKPRQIHKAGEVNISAYFPAEVKASLRMVQAKTGYNVKDCLAEALRDLFRKHNVPVSVDLGEGR
ncbi:MAG: hypothetical protein KGR99_11435 [Betaproteobacteria bacterium]|nr:hypothetical protein [Betaproteobacteria bacterium]